MKSGFGNNKLLDGVKYSFDLLPFEDIVIEDLCFIKFTKKCKIDIYMPYKVNIYKRNNLI